jgi:hypothetical protein
MNNPRIPSRKHYYPFLFALFPALFLFTHNIEEVSFDVLIVPTILALALTGVVWMIGRVVIKDPFKSSLITFVFVFMFFSYGRLFDSVQTLVEKLKVSEFIILFLWVILFGFLAYLVLKTKKSLGALTSFLNIFIAVLLLFSILQTGLFFMSSLNSPQLKTQIPDSLPNSGAPSLAGDLPDIYYLIFDRYANENILRDYYHHDNSDFLRFLEEKGFYDASASRCNYFSTHLSLASSLNMEYLTDLLAKGPVKTRVIYRLLQDFKVRRLLKSFGYKYFHFGSWYEGTRVNRYADLNFRQKGLVPLSQDFLQNLLGTTVLVHFIKEKLVSQNERFLNLEKFKELAELPNLPGPKFVFLHMLMPHHDFYFMADGQPNREKTTPNNQDRQYVSQLEFTNTKIKELVGELLSKSKRPPIIILQSDEGPGEEEKPTRKMLRMTEQDRAVIRLRIRCTILNAYYLPGVDVSRVLYPSISPVNTFRVIFNLYFGSQFPLLKDETYRPVGDKNQIRKFDRLRDWVWKIRLQRSYPQ